MSGDDEVPTSSRPQGAALATLPAGFRPTRSVIASIEGVLLRFDPDGTIRMSGVWKIHHAPYRYFRCLDCPARTCCDSRAYSRCAKKQTGPYPHRWQVIGKGRPVFIHLDDGGTDARP